MQLMPLRRVGSAPGINGHHTTLTETIDTNIGLGTYYLRQVSIPSTPGRSSHRPATMPVRARATVASRPEGAIYIETIPFVETREYVKKVMNNTPTTRGCFTRPT